MSLICYSVIYCLYKDCLKNFTFRGTQSSIKSDKINSNIFSLWNPFVLKFLSSLPSPHGMNHTSSISAKLLYISHAI